MEEEQEEADEGQGDAGEVEQEEAGGFSAQGRPQRLDEEAADKEWQTRSEAEQRQAR